MNGQFKLSRSIVVIGAIILLVIAGTMITLVNQVKAQQHERMKNLFEVSPEIGWGVEGLMPLSTIEAKTISVAGFEFWREASEGPIVLSASCFKWTATFRQAGWKITMMGTAGSESADVLDTAFVSIGKDMHRSGVPSGKVLNGIAIMPSIVLGQSRFHDVAKRLPKPAELRESAEGDCTIMVFSKKTGTSAYEVWLWLDGGGVLMVLDFHAGRGHISGG